MKNNIPYKLIDAPQEQLWQEMLAGRKEALESIYHQYAALLYNYARSFCADRDLIRDCIQDLFTDLWRSRERLSPTTSIKFYLLSAMKRRVIYAVKKNKRLFSTPFESSEEIDISYPYALPESATRESDAEKRQVLQAVESLPVRQKEVIQLIFFENLSRQEVASLMEVDVNTIYMLTWKALKSLRHKLSPLHPVLAISFLHWFL